MEIYKATSKFKINAWHLSITSDVCDQSLLELMTPLIYQYHPGTHRIYDRCKAFKVFSLHSCINSQQFSQKDSNPSKIFEV